MDDVYAGLTELLRPAERGQAPGGWLFGQVQQAGQGTLRVVCGGLTLDQTELHVPPGLDYAWTEDTGGDELLRAGDRLLVLVTADGQDYYILQKEGTAQALPLYRDVAMDYDKGVPRFSGGEPVLASGLEAVKGWAWRALHTERYRWSPFSWDYGCELESLVGQPYRADTRLSEAVRYVREALTVCPYITGAAAEVVGFDGSTLRMRVSLTTVYGEASIHV